jgi:hypothetical protein
MSRAEQVATAVGPVRAGDHGRRELAVENQAIQVVEEPRADEIMLVDVGHVEVDEQRVRPAHACNVLVHLLAISADLSGGLSLCQEISLVYTAATKQHFG